MVEALEHWARLATLLVQSYLANLFSLLTIITEHNLLKKIVFGGSFGLHPIKIQNETLICNKGVYVASNNSVQISTQISIAGILGGMGVFLQKISGSSTIFLDCKGQPITKELGYGETIEVDENHIIALQGISEAQLSSAWSLKNILGGEGLSMLKITGPGRVYLSPGSLIPEYRPTNQ